MTNEATTNILLDKRINMIPSSFKAAEWQYKKRTAQLINNNSALITIKFDGRVSDLFLDNRRLQLKRLGFWRQEIDIVDHGSVLLKQRTIGFWGFTHEVRIGNRLYTAKSSSGSHYRVIYKNAQGKEVVFYDLNAWKWKPKAIFRDDETAAPPTDVALLLIAGYLTLRKMSQDAEGSVAIAAAAG